MGFSWFDYAWPWIGLFGAHVFLVLLFGTNLFRSDIAQSRWRDVVWLSWLAVPVYLVHQFEEYGVSANGLHRFPDELCAQLGLPGYPECPLPPLFYVAVNVSLIWVVGPLVAMMSRRYPLVGLSVYGVIFVNAIVHSVPVVLGRGYDSGFLTSVLIMFPVSFWVAAVQFGPGRLPRWTIAALVTGGVLVHVVLMGSVLLFINDRIDAPVLVVIQVLNAFVIPLLLFVMSKVVRVHPVRLSSG